MKANSVETIQTARKLNKAKVPIKEIAIKLNVCENTVRLWTCQDRHSSKDVFKQWFKKMYIQPGFTYAEFEYHTGVTRATAMKWRDRYFPEMPVKMNTRQSLFIKLIEKKELSVNEYALLLNTTKTSVLRFIKDYESYKLQGIATGATMKRKAKVEKYNQLQLSVK